MKTRCSQEVMKGFHFHQCSRSAWKDGYCKQHHPDTIEERRRIVEEKWQAKAAKSPWILLGKAKKEIEELKAEIKILKG